MPRNGSGSYNLPAQNPVVPGTVITSSWANTTLQDVGAALTQSMSSDGQTIPTANQSLGNFRHTNVSNALQRNEYAAYGQVQDGQPQWMTVTGTDTIVATIAPGPTSYVAGQTFRFVAAGANTTTAVTLNINSIGAKNVTKNGTLPLVVGDIPSGSVVTVTYDGTQFQVISASGTNPIVGAARNVKMLVSTASASATLTADEIIVETALGGVAYKLTSFSKTINLATTGAGGMDTGAAPASGYVVLYAIYNPTTGVSALLAKNSASAVQTETYTGANMPAGYTASALVGVWGTNASSQFRPGSQRDRKVAFARLTILATNTTTGAFTSFSASAALPPNATECEGNISVGNSVNNSLSDALIAADSNGFGAKNVQINGIITSVAPYIVQVLTPQTLYYFLSGAASVGVTINSSGYSF